LKEERGRRKHHKYGIHGGIHTPPGKDHGMGFQEHIVGEKIRVAEGIQRM